MFTNVLFLLLLLLAVDLAPVYVAHPWPSTFVASVFVSTLLYGLSLLLIQLQKGFLKPKWHELASNCILLSFITIFLYLVGFQRFIFKLPLLGATLTTLLSFTLYFIGMSLATSLGHVRFYIPFSTPFLIYVFSAELVFPIVGERGMILFSVFFLLLLFLFLPLLFKTLWKCHPLSSSLLKERLNAFCREAGFRHGGIRVWKLMRHSVTAGIIGVIPRFRFVLFTERLLSQFPEEEIEAILAHEIGHSKHKHLLFYPLLLFGAVVLGALLTIWLDPSSPLLLFLLYAALFALYFRFVFGFFSRQFERQADLYGVTLGLPPATLIDALHRIGEANHIPLDRTNWHHGTLRSRIAALEAAALDPRVVAKHTRFLKIALGIYCFFLVSAITFLITLE